MVRRKNGVVAERERQVQIALAGLRDGTYTSVDQAVKALGVSKTTMYHRIKGGKSRAEAQEPRQLLTRQEEKALARWISTSSATGNPVRHPFILEMAEKLREARLASSTEFIPPIGPNWVAQFLSRHPYLKTTRLNAIEAARIKEVMKEQVLHFNAELRRLIQEHNIRLENIYNADETGCSIGTMQTGNVVVDNSASIAYEAQPGAQEWVTVIECVSATGEKVPPLVIFKGKNLLTSWLPPSLPTGWLFSCNESGWTSNYHGMKWIEHFETKTRQNLQSPDEYRLLICDGHDSHVSAGLITFCLQKRIDLILLPPHSSHLLQPLDVAIFGPLKRAISVQVARLLRSGVNRIQKVEWLERFIEARERAITKSNILAGWRGAGLFPENMHRILLQLPQPEVVSPPSPINRPTTLNPALLQTSSPPDAATLQAATNALLTEISNANVSSPVKTQIKCLTRITNRLQADVTILKKDLKEIKEVHGRRKERQRGKRLILKDRPVASTEEVAKALAAAEKATAAKKKKGTNNRRKKVVDDSDSSEDSEEEIFDCIEVV